MRLSSVRALLALGLATPLAACTVGDLSGPGGGGGGGGGGGDDIGDDDPLPPDAAPVPDYALSISPPMITTTLGTTSEYTLTLQSDYYEGPVDLAVTGLPETWVATFDPEIVVVALNGTTTVRLSIAVPSNGAATYDDPAAVATAPITVEATATPGARTALAELAVENHLYVDIPELGAPNGPHEFPGRIDLKLGAKLSIRNSDDATHRIHSDGGAGFPHQDDDMAQGQAYTVTPGDLGQYRFYCHSHGEGTGVTNLVVAP